MEPVFHLADLAYIWLIYGAWFKSRPGSFRARILYRKANNAYFDQHHRLRTEAQKLRVSDFVLVHYTREAYTRSRARKLDDRWFRPYRIREIPEDSTFYYLEELVARRWWLPLLEIV